MGGGTVPLPRLLPQWGGGYPFPYPTSIYRRLQCLYTIAPLALNVPPKIEILDPPLILADHSLPSRHTLRHTFGPHNVTEHVV